MPRVRLLMMINAHLGRATIPSIEYVARFVPLAWNFPIFLLLFD